MIRQLPRWIKGLEKDSPDRELLVQIFHSSKKPIETPREMNFAIKDFNSADDAKSAAHYAELKGWACRVDSDHRANGKYWLEATKQEYAILPDKLFSDQNDFIRLTKMYGATYDGWYATVV